MKRRTPGVDHVIHIYRTWAAEHSGGVWNKKEAWGDLRQEVLDHLRYTSAQDDWDQLGEMLFNLADDALARAGEKELEDSEQAEALPLELPYPLDTIIAIGNGDRCAFGDMRMAEWIRHDAKKFANLAAVRDSYKEWRRKSDRLIPGLTQGLTVREALQALGETEELEAAA